MIKTFENLATKYIKHENALVICAITMANDPGVSTTSNIIKKSKAEKRTISVLTMPDRLQQGKAHDDYDAIFHGKKYILPRGYFVTKQPGQPSCSNLAEIIIERLASKRKPSSTRTPTGLVSGRSFETGVAQRRFSPTFPKSSLASF